MGDCRCGKHSGRNLVVCIDGTSNQFGKKVRNTNVIELYRLVKKRPEDEQLTYYNSGIGTYAKPSWRSWHYMRQMIDHKIDLAIAWNFEKIVLNAYRWLSDNYSEGDHIYLFGFSRGAYQVRALSAMIEKVGLLYRGNEEQIPFAYELYAADGRGSANTTSNTEHAGTKVKTPAQHFKNTFSRDVKVHFVGVWDTVSSVGVVRHKVLPDTANGMKHVCFFRHALALDERRVKFLPEYVNQGEGEDTGGEKDASSAKPPHTKEVWFVGTHSDIGGGNIENEAMDRKAAPLRWMVFEAVPRGLRLHMLNEDSKDLVVPPTEVHESLTWIWWFLEVLPMKRLSYKGKDLTRRWPPHLGAVRIIKEGQGVHGSVLSAIRSKEGPDYIPRAAGDIEGECPGGKNESKAYWRDFRDNHEKLPQNIERDLHDILDDALRKCVGRFSSIREGDQATPESLLGDIEQWLVLSGHAHIVFSIAVSHDGTRIASGSVDRTVRIWDASTGTALQSPLNGHSDWVRSVAFSPDGTHVVSGSDDHTIRVWNLDTGTTVVGPIEGHTDGVFSVAYSPDGTQIVSGSHDWTIRIWDAQTGAAVGEPLRGYQGYVLSVAFSPDGTRIASGSADKTVRIWDVATGAALGSRLTGHDGWVRLVAFSPDGAHVVSGSDDRTIRVWDVQTGTTVVGPIRGHTDYVYSVAYSPDGSRIVSGSGDRTIRIWDAKTGKAIGKPLTGHEGWVSSVAFSPDGKRVVSGSDDRTVRIWDVEDLVVE
ncbi:hypothetical protein CERSUDRAFT_162065 [Gelatoporia subvermispora B]|uniref:T6SS Phospholipase effector Tle1-like catalytic domain-containing protein n=1 Tax=Ceriporiopsis subvermispora (strain B) TaxID=914234 RepID=M2QIT5_CERS8|nr:hypothetical protein CERSUDRAFT_162065 [Gelatoporia subvermispora B]